MFEFFDFIRLSLVNEGDILDFFDSFREIESGKGFLVKVNRRSDVRDEPREGIASEGVFEVVREFGVSVVDELVFAFLELTDDISKKKQGFVDHAAFLEPLSLRLGEFLPFRAS